MAKIIGVHGIGQQFKGANLIGSQWLPALKDGLSRASYRLASDEDFACAYYGDVFRPAGKSTLDPPWGASDITDPWEIELLELWASEAQSCHRQTENVPTKARTPLLVQRALNALTGCKFFAGLAERLLIADLKQVHRYFTDKVVRQHAHQSIERNVEGDTRVIVAHSLGSVVAYEALCAHPEWPVRTLVTMGSPLGISGLVFEKLQPAPSQQIGAWPPGLRRWFNIADSGDIVALVKSLSPLFNSRVVDKLINNGARAHDSLSYLTSQEVGYAVACEFRS